MLLYPALVFYSSILASHSCTFGPFGIVGSQIAKTFLCNSYKTCVLSSTTAAVSTVLFTAASVW